MRHLLALTLTLMIVAPAAAHDLGNRAPDKSPVVHQPPPADPDVIRQGGDTIFDAIYLAIPAANVTGSTAGYSNDYDEICPYPESWSPDVVYRVAPTRDMELDFDMFGSFYDTKIYIYDEAFQLVACNDDFHSDYTSKIEQVALAGDSKYYLVIDGYGGDSGEYRLNVTEYEPCVLDCWPDALLENEPPLTENYVDWHNGGCNTDVVDPPFTHIYAHHHGTRFCGTSGFFPVDGGSWRDTDWFVITFAYFAGVLEIRGDAEVECYMFELAPMDCGEVEVVQNWVIGPCDDHVMSIYVYGEDAVWFWVGPTTFAAPDGSDLMEFDYTLLMVGGEPYPPVATEARNWSSIKSLFR